MKNSNLPSIIDLKEINNAIKIGNFEWELWWTERFPGVQKYIIIESRFFGYSRLYQSNALRWSEWYGEMHCWNEFFWQLLWRWHLSGGDIFRSVSHVSSQPSGGKRYNVLLAKRIQVYGEVANGIISIFYWLPRATQVFVYIRKRVMEANPWLFRTCQESDGELAKLNCTEDYPMRFS